MAMATPVHVLCFGASITAGWNQLGLRYDPYAATLEARLKEVFPNRIFSIQVDGKICNFGDHVPTLEPNIASRDMSWKLSLSERVAKLATPPQTSKTDAEVIMQDCRATQ